MPGPSSNYEAEIQQALAAYHESMRSAGSTPQALAEHKRYTQPMAPQDRQAFTSSEPEVQQLAERYNKLEELLAAQRALGRYANE